MNKLSLDRTYANVKSFLEKFAEDAVTWLKKHKKLVVVGTALYLAFAFLFDDGEDTEEE